MSGAVPLRLGQVRARRHALLGHVAEDEATVRRAQFEGARLGDHRVEITRLRRHLLAVLRSLTESDLGNSLIVSVAAGSQYFIVAAARCATAHEMSTRFAATAGPNFPHFYVDFIYIHSPNQQLKPEPRCGPRQGTS